MLTSPAAATLRRGESRTLQVQQPLLGKNLAQAAANRALFAERRLAVVNVLSSPGAGKTALLERTLGDLAGDLRCGVIVGDLATDNDALRLRRHGAPCLQITTGNVCHLEAQMIADALGEFDLAALDLLWIENVGNLVCPAGYDLGESARVVLLAATEGEDKPLKYPRIYKTADVVAFTKCDLVAAAEVNPALARQFVAQVAPQALWLEVSARSGLGLADWYAYIRRVCTAAKSGPSLAGVCR